MPSSSFSFLFEALAAQPERRLGSRGEIGLQVLDVLGDGRRRVGGGVGQISQDVEIVEPGERPRQILLDERKHPAPGLEGRLDEDARALP